MRFASVPFKEAIDFFRQKVNLPTEKWTDLMNEMHSRAFVVAGAMKSELLSDMRTAIDDAISKGTTITEFRKAFDETVKKHGWDYKGNRGWRTGVIFNTNLRVAWSAGHYKQMTDPDVLKARPYWRYRRAFRAPEAATPRMERDCPSGKRSLVGLSLPCKGFRL